MPRHPDAVITPNAELRARRQRLPSPHRAGQCLSRAELAEAVNTALRELFPDRNPTSLDVDARWVGKLERGEHRWPCEERRAALRQVVGAETDAVIGLYSPRRGEAVRPARGRPPIDVGTAHPARRYNYWLGGKDHFAADRESADAIAKVLPAAATAARENRAFLRRAVRHLAERGVRQFLDVGAGLPADGNTHEVAQSVDPACRIVYVDNDPIVMAHARARLAGDPAGRVGCVEADLREPEAILAHPAVTGTLDPDHPVALLLVAVLHFLPGDEAVRDAVRRFTTALPAGSFLVLSHGTLDFAPESAEAYEELLRAGLADMRPRPRHRIAALLDGLDLLEPGLVPLSEWRPARPGASPAEVSAYGAVARLPS
ncbi:SAM-dependent methyltransferase [Actinoplanes sp. NPDC049802]|uniref:SAM-dependent methyltransferase n=1 Tax=Actinoplanes sp. NPDC049802 TaxID=3154742 RepID=UPI00340796D7